MYRAFLPLNFIGAADGLDLIGELRRPKRVGEKKIGGQTPKPRF